MGSGSGTSGSYGWRGVWLPASPPDLRWHLLAGSASRTGWNYRGLSRQRFVRRLDNVLHPAAATHRAARGKTPDCECEDRRHDYPEPAPNAAHLDLRRGPAFHNEQTIHRLRIFL